MVINFIEKKVIEIFWCFLFIFLLYYKDYFLGRICRVNDNLKVFVLDVEIENCN